MSDVSFDYDASRAAARAGLEADLSPEELIPGGLHDLTAAASSAGAIATQLTTTRRAIKYIDLHEKEWEGDAAFSFFSVRDDDLRLFGTAASSFDDTEKALTGYVRELEAARRTAANARTAFQAAKRAQLAALAEAHKRGRVEDDGTGDQAGEDAVTSLVGAMHDVFLAAQKAADVVARAADDAPPKQYLVQHHGPPASWTTVAKIPKNMAVDVFTNAVGFGEGIGTLGVGAFRTAHGKLTGDRTEEWSGIYSMEDGGKKAISNGAQLALDGVGPGDLTLIKELLKGSLSAGLKATLRDALREARPRASVLPCRDPVDVATGAVFLDQVDVELPGVLPLVLRRRYVSDWRHGEWFGRSWASTLDERVDVSDTYAAVVLGDATMLTYPLPSLGESAMPIVGQRWPLERVSEELIRVTDPETGQVRHFARVRPGRFVLIGITEPNGHGVLVIRDQDGTPREVRHTGGYRVLVDADASIAGGRITGLSVVGEAGPMRLTTYSYDADGRLSGVTDSSGLPLEFEYDDLGRLVRWTDRNRVTFRYAYDERDRCVRQALAGGDYAARFGYRELDDGLTETTVVDSQGGRSVFVADVLGLVVSETDQLGRTTRSSWDDAGRLTSRTDPLGRTTTWLHDDASLTVGRPDGRREHTVFGVFGGRRLPTRSTLPDGTVWSRSYDSRGNCRSVTDPLGATTTADYDEHGHLVAITDPAGLRRTFACDAAGLPVTVTEPGGAVTRLERDAFGRVVTLVDPLGARTSYAWTPEGRLAARTLPDGSTERWTYDGEGNPIEHIDATGRATRSTYTAFDLLASVTAPDGAVTRLRYDSELRLTAVVGALGREWRYTYDAAGQLVAETDYNGRTLGYEYDAAGLLTRRVNGAGETIDYSRDALGLVVSQHATTPGGEAATVFEHDPLGRLLRATSADADLVLDRDPLGRVVAESVDGRALSSAYDAVGRRLRRTTPAGVVSEWSYGPDGLPSAVALDGHAIGLEHDLAGRVTRRGLPGETTLEQTYDAAGRLLGQRVEGRADLLGRRYAYDAGRLVGVDDRLSGARRFELDLADRITRVDGPLELGELYAYDPLGNITRAVLPGDDTPADAQRRDHSGTLLTRAGRTRYAYDRQGRLIRQVRTRLSRKPEVWTYAWDAEDRLVSVRTPDGVTWHYTYDALGRRVAKRRLGEDGAIEEEVRFAWDGPTLVEETSAGGVRAWVHDGFAPLAQLSQSAPTSQDEVDARFYAIVTDLIGSPTEVLDEDGTLVWHAHRTLWGAPADSSAEPVPLRFPGQYADDETGLYYNLHRYYDPTTGRYLTQDPLGLAPAPNANTYVANPTVLCDPLGLAPCGLPGVGTRVVNYRPKELDPNWGLTPQHLHKHLFGNGPHSLKMIDPAGNPDIWRDYLQELAARPTTATHKGGIEDVIGTFQKADGSGSFRLGIRLSARPDGTYDLVTLLTKQ